MREEGRITQVTKVEVESKAKVMGTMKVGFLALIARAGADMQVCQETVLTA